MKLSSSSVTEVEEFISKVIKFINDYKWIIDTYVSGNPGTVSISIIRQATHPMDRPTQFISEQIAKHYNQKLFLDLWKDFFVKCLHQQVTSSWWTVLSSLHPQELASLLHKDTWNSSQVWPLSLLAFRTVVTELPLPRENVQQSSQVMCWDKELDLLAASKAFDQNECIQLAADSSGIKNGQLRELEHCYRRHVKPKKQHEIIKLAELIKSLCESCSCNHVVDVGAGQGHLARLLSFGHGIQVTTLEAVSCHTPKAKKYDREVINDVMKRKKTLSADEEKLRKLDEVSYQLAEPSHVIAMITSNMSMEDFLNMLHKKQACFKDIESFGRNYANSRMSSGSRVPAARTQQCKDASVDAGIRSQYRSHVVDSIGAHKQIQSDTVNGSYMYTEERLNTTDVGSNHVQHTLTAEDHNSISTLCSLDQAKGCNSCVQHHLCAMNDRSTHVQCSSSITTVGASYVQQNLSTADGIQYICSTANGADVQHTPIGTHVQQNLSIAGGTSVQQTLSMASSTRKQDSLSTEDQTGTHIEQDSSNAADSCDDFILTGLHACGDLTSTMLRVFVQCPQAVGLASVGCCYMKLSTESLDTLDEDRGFYGYPMSNFVRSLPGHQLSYEAREMACHFIDCYHDRLKNNLPQLRSHAYRAALQEIIHQKAPHLQHGSIKVTVKHTEELSFTQYAKVALKKLKLSEKISDEQLVVAESRLKHWHHVVAFYTLRLSLAPLVEMVLLLDRALYLAENGIPCKLLPLFDAKLSPRNFVLIAKR